MLKRVEVKAFQSIHDISLDLGKFTVIVGKSNVGKSAFLRAIKALAFNIRGNMHVTLGEKYSTVKATLPDWVLSLERGEGRSIYIITDIRTGNKEVLPKLNKTVPEEVSSILNVDESNFSVQFDTPFLVTDSGAQVARVLGELTNVSTIFEAVKEGNRRRLNLSSELKTRQVDLDEVKKEFEVFQDLPNQITRLEYLEKSLDDVQEIENNLDVISSISVSLENSQWTLDNISSYPDLPDFSEITYLNDKVKSLNKLIDELSAALNVLKDVVIYSEIPSLDTIYEINDKWSDLSNLTQSLTDAMVLIQDAKVEINESYSLGQYYTESIRKLLVENGICPTCRQSVSL